MSVNPLNTELNPIRHLLALVGARHIVHVSRIRVKVYSSLSSRWRWAVRLVIVSPDHGVP